MQETVQGEVIHAEMSTRERRRSAVITAGQQVIVQQFPGLQVLHADIPSYGSSPEEHESSHSKNIFACFTLTDSAHHRSYAILRGREIVYHEPVEDSSDLSAIYTHVAQTVSSRPLRYPLLYPEDIRRLRFLSYLLFPSEGAVPEEESRQRAHAGNLSSETLTVPEIASLTHLSEGEPHLIIPRETQGERRRQVLMLERLRRFYRSHVVPRQREFTDEEMARFIRLRDRLHPEDIAPDISDQEKREREILLAKEAKRREISDRRLQNLRVLEYFHFLKCTKGINDIGEITPHELEMLQQLTHMQLHKFTGEDASFEERRRIEKMREHAKKLERWALEAKKVKDSKEERQRLTELRDIVAQEKAMKEKPIRKSLQFIRWAFRRGRINEGFEEKTHPPKPWTEYDLRGYDTEE